jgi:hypothetical protein
MGRPLPWRRGAAYPRTVILAGAKGVSTMAQNESQTTLLRLSDTALDVGDESYYGHVYRHYGYPPYWGPGYVYPPYPHYPYP